MASVGARAFGSAATLALAFAMMAAAARLAPAQPAAAPAAPGGAAAAPGLDSPRVQNTLAVLDRLRRITEDDLRQPGACPWDVPAKASELGHDVGRSLAFVRDEVRYEPYAGVLRGPRGALASRAANAADKSLLLRDLLVNGGHRCRLVTGTLPDDKAQALVKQFLSADPARGPLAELAGDANPDPQAIQRYAARAGLDPALVMEAALRDQQAARDVQQNVWNAARREAEWVLSRLAESNVRVGRPPEQWASELAARVKPHVWVQVEQDGKWVDLDPAFAGSEPGQRQAQGETPVDDAALSPSSPGTGPLERHRMAFKLNYVVEEAGAPKEQPILDVVLFADESLFEPSKFAVYPIEPQLPDYTAMEKMSPDQLKAMLAGFKKFQAVVRSGRKTFSSKPFDLDGNLFEVANDGRVAAAADVGAAGGALFGGLGGAVGGGAGGKQAGPKLLEINVQMTLQSPGAQPRPQKRVLVTGEQRTKGGTLCAIREWELLLQGFPISSEAAQYAGASNVLAIYGPMVEMLRKPDLSMADVQRYLTEIPPTYAAALVEFAMLRQQGMADLAAAEPNSALLWDRPQVYIADRHGCSCHDAEGYTACLRLDIVDNTVVFVPRQAGQGASEAAARATVTLGAFDTFAEAAFVAAVSPAGKVSSAATSLSDVRLRGGRLAVFPAAQAGPGARAALHETDAAWIRSFEPADRVILAAAGDGAAGAGGAAPAGGGAWWSLDPATGAILGRVSGGGGQAQVEYKTIVLRIAEHMICNMGWITELIVGAKEFSKGELTVVQGGKRGAIMLYNMGKCMMKLPKADFKEVVKFKELWAAAKDLKGGFLGIADALAG